MADHLRDRLGGQEPGVDEGAAPAAPGRARRPRGGLAGISLVVIAVLLATAATAAIVSSTHADRRDAATVRPTTATRGVLSASTIRDGVEVTVLPAGSRSATGCGRRW